MLRQTFLIAKGYFDPKEYFQAIKIDNLDDPTFDNKIKAMFNWSPPLSLAYFWTFFAFYSSLNTFDKIVSPFIELGSKSSEIVKWCLIKMVIYDGLI